MYRDCFLQNEQVINRSYKNWTIAGADRGTYRKIEATVTKHFVDYLLTCK